jgi:hypothetical protein
VPPIRNLSNPGQGDSAGNETIVCATTPVFEVLGAKMPLLVRHNHSSGRTLGAEVG